MKEFKFKVEGQDWESAIDKAFERANKKVTIDGFRPGHAPKDVFMKKYGKESLLMDAADIAMNEIYVKTLAENKDIQIVAEPQVKLGNLALDSFEFSIELVTAPEVKLGKYKNLGVAKPKVEVTDEEVHDEIHMLQHRFEESIIKEGPADFHDVVTMDFEGFKEGVPFDGGKAENYELQLGSQSFIPGFEEQLVGLKKGDEKEVHVTFPDEYPSEELKGQPVVFKIKVHEVTEQRHPELDDQFFEDLAMDGVKDVDSLVAVLKENIKARKEVELENKYVEDLLAKAAENMKVTIPEAMISSEIHRMMHQYEDNLKLQGITLEQYYQFTNSTEDQLEEQMKPEATNRVKYRLLLDEIVKAEKIEVTEEDVKKESKLMAEKYNMEEEKFLELFGGLDTLKYDMQLRRALEIIKEN
jgi:trigger factor